MAKHTVIGLDLAKNSNALVAFSPAGKELWRKTLSRSKLQSFLARQQCSVVVMEACSGAHFIGQKVQEMGHTAVLYPPKHVKGYLRGQKNDYNDARALVEAHQHGHLRPVPIKTVEQQDRALILLQRKQLKEEQVRQGNQIRAMLAERGIVLPTGVSALRTGLPRVLEDAENGLTEVVRHILTQAYERFLAVIKEQQWYDQKLNEQARENEVCRRLCGAPGMGPIVSNELLSWMGDGQQFKCGRDASAALGLVPRQYSTGGREVLLGITKKGNRHVRSQVINGAQAVLQYAARKDDALSQWVMRIKAKHGHNKAVVALANKLVRIAWVIIARGECYQPRLSNPTA